MAKYQKLVKRKQKDNANVVFVGGLRKTTEEDRVCSHFAKFGQVEHVDIKRQPDGTSRGFAFVKFADQASVDRVIEAHAKHMIDNKWVEVKRHDGMAACAGMTASLQKKAEEQAEEKVEEEPEPARNHEEFEEQWSAQYLQMAQQLGSQQQMQLQQQAQENAMKQQMQAAQAAMKNMGGMMGGGMMNPMMGMGGMMMQPGMAMGVPGMPGMMMPDGGKSGKPRPIGAMPGSPSRSRSGSRSSRSRSRSSRSGSRRSSRSRGGTKRPGLPPPPPPPPGTYEGPIGSVPAATPPLHQEPGGNPADFGGTLSSMLKPPESAAAAAASNEAAENEAAKAAARAAAATVAAFARSQAVQNAQAAQENAREAAARAAKASEETRAHGRYNDEDRGRDDHRPMKLWLPDRGDAPAAAPPEPERRAGRPEPAPVGTRERLGGPPRRRSRSNSRNARKRSRSPKPRRGGGWDNDVPPPASSSTAPPSRPALPPGQSEVLPGGKQQWGGHVQMNRFGIPEASREALAAAMLRAQQVEAAGLDAIRQTGQIPRGPPDLPTGTEVIEQKCVAYLIGKGGQALAAINAAAGVSIQIDQSTKTFGWSMANIYGTEEGAVKAKMILRQKISEYRPLRA